MITIIDYNAGNPMSVRLALQEIGVESCLTSDADGIRKAKRLIFPGVGAARYAMQQLQNTGLIEPIRQVITHGTPFLGICLGMQVLFDETEENNGTATLGIIPGNVKLFRPENHREKVPQIGWNDICIRSKHPVLNGISDGSYFYFVHSYYVTPRNVKQIVATTRYCDVDFTSICGHKNLLATQFHPEKSGHHGLTLLKNFSQWDGTTVDTDGTISC